MKSNVKQKEMKELVAVSYKFLLQVCTLKLKIQCKK